MDDQYKLWDEFLLAWPIERLKKMSLGDYTSTGEVNTFTYWMENRLNEMGSISGGSSFKFGVYRRLDANQGVNDRIRSYLAEYAWLTSLGQTAEDAFTKVRSYVVNVAESASKGNLSAIDSLRELGDVYKWKIAFHYQKDRDNPIILPVFKRVMLASFVEGSARESMASLQGLALKNNKDKIGVLEFGKRIWEAWDKKNLVIWKLSHGDPPNFSNEERQAYKDKNQVVVDTTSVHGQGRNFVEAPVGTVFFLCHGNSTELIGKFTSAASSCDKGNGWQMRSYQPLIPAKHKSPYAGPARAWSPRSNRSFAKVPMDQLLEFESELLKPLFDMRLKELVESVGDVPVKNSDSVDDESLVFEKIESGEGVNTSPCVNRIYYGPPGTGKTYIVLKLLQTEYGMSEANNGISGNPRYKFVTFHQSYGYEEFVEGLRPVLGVGTIQYEIRPGAFKSLCDEARKNPQQRFAMVIDEINRGNISKVFGELITLIEPDKREGQNNVVSVSLAYSGEPFSVPANVDIIGTMNTADRSLALLDTALRRRFEFVPLFPDTSAQKQDDDPQSAPLAALVITTQTGDIDVRLMLEKMNQRIEALYDRDHTIGHAYFTPLITIDDADERFDELASIFRNRIMPLLEEYFFEDLNKIRLVLGDNQKLDCNQFFQLQAGQDVNQLFGNDYDLDGYAIKPLYALQLNIFKIPAAYIGIYQPSV